MNNDIIRMAREAGFMVVADGDPEIGDWYECFTHEIERFAELVRANEREACAKLFDDRDNGIGFYEPHEPAEIIRARGKQ